MDLPSHALPEGAVDELMACDPPLAGELRRNDARREMRAVRRLHAHLCSGQSGPDQLRDLLRIHGRQFSGYH